MVTAVPGELGEPRVELSFSRAGTIGHDAVKDHPLISVAVEILVDEMVKQSGGLGMAPGIGVIDDTGWGIGEVLSIRLFMFEKRDDIADHR